MHAHVGFIARGRIAVQYKSGAPIEFTAPQIVAHHNATIAQLGNFGPPVAVTPAADVRFNAG